MENQWWPGFTFTKPSITERLLDAIPYARKGILLDTGHLMNCEPALSSQKEGAAYLDAMLSRHGDLCRYIQGVHLHQSLSGNYVRNSIGAMPEDLPTEDHVQRFSYNYAHIQRIDRHEPWTDPAIIPILERIAPCYLTHELAGKTEVDRMSALSRQVRTLQQGGLSRESITASSD